MVLDDTQPADARSSAPDEPATAQAPPSQLTTCLTLACVGIALLFYLLSLLFIFDIGRGGDPHSHALAQGLAMLAQLVLWVPLGLFVLLSVVPTPLPGRVKAIGLGLALLGAAGSAMAIGMMSGPDLLVLPPVILPLLVGAFAIWARARDSASPPERIAIGFAAIAVPLVVGPFIAYERWVAAAPEREAQWARERAEQDRRVRAELAAEEARFRALGPQSRLDDVLPFLDSAQAERARALIPTLETGEADAARLLHRGIDLYRFERLHAFGLEMTPDLCRAYRARIAGRLRGIGPAQPEGQTVLYELQSQLPNLRWFMTNGCDASPEARALLAGVQRVQADYGLQDYADELEAILSLRATPSPANAP